MPEERLEFHPEAGSEVVQAHLWYLKLGESLGQRFLDEYHRSRDRVLENPRSFPRTYKVYRYCLLNTFPYKIIYRLKGAIVYVLAFAHASKRPGYWRHRR